jgi:hypothetical protein
MIKKVCIMLACVGGFVVMEIPKADAQVIRGVTPVRRVVTPPYPIARRAVVGPVYRPYVARPYVARPYVARRPIYAAPPVFMGPRVGGGVFIGF